ncbi:MAG: hypothetical protein Q9162_002629 [Coniocarpon cinnabarinum]
MAQFMQFADLKKEPYVSLNPNGRVPTIEDPNTGITLWETGAIIQYLVENYDKDHKISYADKTPEKYHTDQWLFFQVSGQGPYFGQASWFLNFHPEKIPSAIERYRNEVKRVVKVVDSHLKKQGTSYLVGNKCTYADLAWVTWNMMFPFIMGSEEAEQFRPEVDHFFKWHESLMARPAVSKVAKDKQAAKEQQGH